MKTLIPILLLSALAFSQDIQKVVQSPSAKPKHYTELSDANKLKVRDSELSTYRVGVRIIPLQIELNQSENAAKSTLAEAISSTGRDPADWDLDSSTWTFREKPKPQAPASTQPPKTEPKK